jgi:histone H3/H4
MSATPPVPTPPTPVLASSQAELEYRSLTSYFEKLVKYTSAAITVLVAVAGFLFWKSTADVKSDATAAISATRESAGQQISKIMADAASIAQSAAQKAIDQALEKPNIQQMIQKTTQEKVGPAVDQQVQRDLGPKIDAFRNLVTEIGEISNHGAQLREGFRPGLEYLVRKLDSLDPTVRAYARSTLVQIGSDYEGVVNSRFGVGVPGGPTSALAAFIPPPNTPKTAKELMMTIRTIQQMHMLAAAFIDMKKLVGWDVQTFDIPAAERWCASHKPKCDQ